MLVGSESVNDSLDNAEDNKTIIWTLDWVFTWDGFFMTPSLDPRKMYTAPWLFGPSYGAPTAKSRKKILESSSHIPYNEYIHRAKKFSLLLTQCTHISTHGLWILLVSYLNSVQVNQSWKLFCEQFMPYQVLQPSLPPWLPPKPDCMSDDFTAGYNLLRGWLANFQWNLAESLLADSSYVPLYQVTIITPDTFTVWIFIASPTTYAICYAEIKN